MMASATADAHGRLAATPWAIPARGWIEVLKRTWREATEDSIGLIAAGVAFYGFLAIAPLLAATVLLYGLVADPADVGKDLQAMLAILPPDAVKIVGDLLVAAVHTSEGKKGIGLLIALGIALYGGMNAAGALVTALNIAYEEQETRGYVRVTLIALAMTASGVSMLALALGAAALFGHARAYLPDMPPALAAVGRIMFVLLMAIIGAAAAATLYRYGPDRREARWIWLSPGSLAASLLSILISLAFGLYASRFGNYGATYGSAGAIVVTLTWLYLSAYVLLLGGELNSELEHQTARDSTKGPEKPIGMREAVVADHVAGLDPAMDVRLGKGPSPIEPAAQPKRVADYAMSRAAARAGSIARLSKAGRISSAAVTIGLGLVRQKGRAPYGAALIAAATMLAWFGRRHTGTDPMER